LDILSRGSDIAPTKPRAEASVFLTHKNGLNNAGAVERQRYSIHAVLLKMWHGPLILLNFPGIILRKTPSISAHTALT
jgi:hypothetical protein